MTNDGGTPMRDPWLGRVLRVTVGPVLASLYRTRAVGIENVPGGAAILCGNHDSYMDPVLLWIKAPRPVRFMAKREVWRFRIMAWAMPRVWAFPVTRGEPDRQAIAAASAVLSEGQLLGIFPEGTRHHEGRGEAQNGAAFLAIRSGAPVVPVGVAGTDRIKPKGARFIRFPRVTIKFGSPIDPADFAEGGRKERVETMTAEIMRRIVEELEEARTL